MLVQNIDGSVEVTKDLIVNKVWVNGKITAIIFPKIGKHSVGILTPENKHIGSSKILNKKLASLEKRNIEFNNAPQIIADKISIKKIIGNIFNVVIIDIGLIINKNILNSNKRIKPNKIGLFYWNVKSICFSIYPLISL